LNAIALASKPRELWFARALPPASISRANVKRFYTLLKPTALSRKLEQLTTADVYFGRGELIHKERRKIK
jgi:hypothetical protein